MTKKPKDEQAPKDQADDDRCESDDQEQDDPNQVAKSMMDQIASRSERPSKPDESTTEGCQ